MKKFLLAILILSLAFCAEAGKKKGKKFDFKNKKKETEKAVAFKIPAGWMTKLGDAQKLAAQKKLPILILISGPEWCGPCKKLESAVINQSKFKTEAGKKAVRVYLHLPQSNCPAATRADIKKCTFFQNGVPCYAVVDENLNILATPKSRTPQAFLAAIDEAAQKMKKK